MRALVTEPANLGVVFYPTLQKHWGQIKTEGILVEEGVTLYSVGDETQATTARIPTFPGPPQVLIFVDVEKAMADGIEFFQTSDPPLAGSAGQKEVEDYQGNVRVMTIEISTTSGKRLHPRYFHKVVDTKTGRIRFMGRELDFEGEADVKSVTDLKYFAILDFEATCDTKKIPFQEIIEFPIVLLDADSGEPVRDTEGRAVEQVTFVRPTRVPLLTPFCTELTSITQEDVDGAPPLDQVLKHTDEFLRRNGCTDDNFIFVTCGDWDLNVQLPKQCREDHMACAGYLKRWLNLKRLFDAVMGKQQVGMARMLKLLDLDLVGHHHRGIDDCRNIGRILQHLMQRGPPQNAATTVNEHGEEITVEFDPAKASLSGKEFALSFATDREAMKAAAKEASRQQKEKAIREAQTASQSSGQ
eukprot:GFYU01001021.1.p1 GENE.GFYU01001021.1~~GFYU01001021.1.p1  ORF type:complete len:414 (-),score=64.02 GFYU01001021.1:152-1393(-)